MSKNNNEFFMEIFNEILRLNDNDIIIIYDKNGNIWFSLRDIIKTLGYNNYKKAGNKLNISKENIKIYNELTRGTPGGGCY
jgi:prophage antirepressor-like protein